jgi:hypothetical protein
VSFLLVLHCGGCVGGASMDTMAVICGWAAMVYRVLSKFKFHFISLRILLFQAPAASFTNYSEYDATPTKTLQQAHNHHHREK